MWRRTGDAEADRAARAARIVTLGAALLFLLVLTAWRPWELFVRAGYSADFYDEQARSFLRGRLAVRPEVATIEGFEIDGRTYLYYGPFLALARLPFALIDLPFDGAFAGRLAAASMVAAFVVLCTAAFHLGRAALAWWGGQRPGRDTSHDGVRLAVLVAAVAASPALFLAGWISVYHETELWAAAFAVWACVGALRLCATDAVDRRDLVVASAGVVAATLTRATVGIGVGLGVVAAVAFVHRRSLRRVVPLGAAALAGVATHVASNVARFGTLLSLPADRQVLTLQNPDRAAWFAGNDGSFFGLRFLPTTLVHYLRPDAIRFERLLPIVRFGPPADVLGSYPVESNTPASSLTVTATLLFAAALVGVVVLVRRRAWPWLLLVAGGALASAPSFAIGFVANRYLVDMLPMLVVPAAVAVAVCPWPDTATTRRVAAVGIVALVGWGTWSNVALATWTQQIKEPGFHEWRHAVDDALFGGTPPGVVDVRAGDPAPRDGIVGLDPDCSGAYVAEQGKWVPLERRLGDRLLEGTVRLGGESPGDETVVATGPDWTLTAVLGDISGTAFARLDGPGGTTATGRAVAWTSASDVRVVLDPVVPELRVEVDGTSALFGFDVPPGPAAPTAAFEQVSGDGGDSLCRRLEARR